jgi:hypothetical protein
MDDLAACAGRTNLDATVTHADDLTLLAALVEPVDVAAYWQQPDDEDHALADPAVRDVLLPVAERAGTTGGESPAGPAHG